MMEVWEDVDTDRESEDSEESDQDAATQESEGEYSDHDTTVVLSASPGPSSTSAHTGYLCHAHHGESALDYNWVEDTEGNTQKHTDPKQACTIFPILVGSDSTPQWPQFTQVSWVQTSLPATASAEQHFLEIFTTNEFDLLVAICITEYNHTSLSTWGSLDLT